MPKYWVTLHVAVEAADADEACNLVEDAVSSKISEVEIISTEVEEAY